MKVKEVADLVGISVRTLHHYDEIGLLQPDTTTEAGYRIYSEASLEKLQQILFFKEVGVPLKQIKTILEDPSFDREEALEMHRKMLVEKRRRLNQVIETVEKTLRHWKGEIKMTAEEKFKGFDFSQNPYEKEARERWGDKAVEEANKKVKGMNEAKQEEINELYRELAAIRHQDPASQEVQEAIAKWYVLLNEIGSYSLDAFKGLGQMYITDERFSKNIDQFGDGLAQFMADAMAIYADNRQLN